MNTDSPAKFWFECCTCKKTYKADIIRYLCDDCNVQNIPNQPPKGVLKTVYDYRELKRSYSKGFLLQRLIDFQFIDLLPINDLQNLSPLKVGKTPLYQIDYLDNEKLPVKLFLKDDSQNPTFSFKDRASNIVSAYAKENQIDTIVAASTGNAGSSLAGICASQRQKAVIVVPAKAPIAKLVQIAMYGAQIVPVEGNYDLAFDLSIEITAQFGWYNRNTAYNPLTIEGKKTVAYELFIDFKKHAPEMVFVPVGDGVILSGVYKGFEDLLHLSLIDKMPKIIAVQAEGSKNIVNNLYNTDFQIITSSTIADSISVDIPRNYFMAKNFIQKYDGNGITVTNDEIISASMLLSRNTGIFTEPAAAAAFAGFLKFKKTKLDELKNAVVLLTGSGLKDLQSVLPKIKLPQPIKPTIENAKKLLFNN